MREEFQNMLPVEKFQQQYVQSLEKYTLCILPDGTNGAPCGACCELMVQLMAGKYYDIEIMLDYSTERTIKLGETTPEWWIK